MFNRLTEQTDASVWVEQEIALTGLLANITIDDRFIGCIFSNKGVAQRPFQEHHQPFRDNEFSQAIKQKHGFFGA